MSELDPPRLICPHTDRLRPGTERVLRGLGAEFREVGGSDSDYWTLLEELWRAGRPFIVVEHDVEPTPQQLRELAECEQPLCAYRYQYGAGEPVWALGCTRFGPRILRRRLNWRFRWSVLAHDEKPRWQDASAYLLGQLPPAHLHEGLVQHHGGR